MRKDCKNSPDRRACLPAEHRQFDQAIPASDKDVRSARYFLKGIQINRKKSFFIIHHPATTAHAFLKETDLYT